MEHTALNRIYPLNPSSQSSGNFEEARREGVIVNQSERKKDHRRTNPTKSTELRLYEFREQISQHLACMGLHHFFLHIYYNFQLNMFMVLLNV